MDVNDKLESSIIHLDNFFNSLKNVDSILMESIRNSYRAFGENVELFKLYLETIETNDNKYILESVDAAIDAINNDIMNAETGETKRQKRFTAMKSVLDLVLESQEYPSSYLKSRNLIYSMWLYKGSYDIEKVDMFKLFNSISNKSDEAMSGLLIEALDYAPEAFTRSSAGKIMTILPPNAQNAKNALLQKLLSGEI